MTPRDFFFWLQGYFELRNGDVPLTPAQATCVVNHAALVSETLRQLGDDGPLPERLTAIRTLAELIVSGMDPGLLTGKSSELLFAQFEHVIDPSMGTDQQALNTAHEGKPAKPSRPHGLHGRPPILKC